MKKLQLKKIRTGFTSGTCAQAAAKGACLMLVRQARVDKVEIETPSKVKLKLKLVNQDIGKSYAKCAVIKDSGDDPDVTNGAKIYAEVRLSDEQGISIKGGVGVGKVTNPGLAVGVGEWAINPVPRKMIEKEISDILNSLFMGRRDFLVGAEQCSIPTLGDIVGTRMSRLSRNLLQRKGFEVIISVPKGEELAKRTFNPNLGIVGGISIIGTTGIVEPKSLDAYKTSLSLQLNVLKAQGYNKVVLVLGYVGEKYCKVETQYIASSGTQNFASLQNDSIIKIGDHVGFMLDECAKKQIKEVLLVGHIGKLIKVTNGQFNTHCKFGDNRIGSIARYAKLCGATEKTIADISKETTAEATIEILRKAGLSAVFERIAKDVVKKSAEFVNNKVVVNCILLSLSAEVLATTVGGF